jgi:hypothetical protein
MTHFFRPILSTTCVALLMATNVTDAPAAGTAARNAARRWTLNTADTKLTLSMGVGGRFRIGLWTAGPT